MHKKKAKVLVIGTYIIKWGDAGAGKSTLVQVYAKKGYQFTSDYNLVYHEWSIDPRSRSVFKNNSLPRIKDRCWAIFVWPERPLVLWEYSIRHGQESRSRDGGLWQHKCLKLEKWFKVAGQSEKNE